MKAQSSHSPLRSNTNMSHASNSKSIEPMRKSSILLGTDKKYSTYRDALTTNQDKHDDKIQLSAREREPLESIKEMVKDNTRMGLKNKNYKTIDISQQGQTSPQISIGG